MLCSPLLRLRNPTIADAINRRLSAAVIGLLCCSAAAADDANQVHTAMELRAIEVVGSTPLPSVGQPLETVPDNVQLANDKDINRHEAVNMTDFMRRNLGSVYSNETLANPFQPDVSYRGFSASPVLGTPIGMSVYQDGVRVNEPFGDVVNWDLIPRAAIASMELVPGSNPLFGLNTLGGALSIRTKSGISHPGTRAQAYGGSFDRWNIEAEHGGTYKNFDWFFAGNVFKESGFRNFSDSAVHQSFAKLGWESGSTDIDLTYTYADNKLTGNGAAPQSLISADRTAVYAHPEITRPELHFLNLTLLHSFSDSWLLSGNAYYRRSNVRVDAGDIELEQENSGEFDVDPVLNQTRTRQTGWGGAFELSNTDTFFARPNRAVAGATCNFGDTDFDQFRHDAVLGPTRRVIPEADETAQLRTRLNAENAYYGVFFTDTYSPTPWFNLTGSVRWNHADIHLDGITIDDEAETEDLAGRHSFQRTNPAAGFTLLPLRAMGMDGAADSLTLFANYSEGFRVPSPVELTCANPEEPCALPTNFVSDPPLKPIVARTYEAGMRGKIASVLDWNLAYFRTDISDDILFINASGAITRGYFRNVGNTRREGLEFGVKGQTEKLHWYANYSFIDATYQSNIDLQNAIGPVAVQAGDHIPSVPEHLLKAGVAYEFRKGWRLGIDLMYTGSQFLRGDDHNRLAVLPDYVVVNLNTSYQVLANVELFAFANNVFDENYNSFGLINRSAFSSPAGQIEPFVSPGAGIAGWAGIRIRLD